MNANPAGQIRAAFAFLTRIPVGSAPIGADAHGGSAAWFTLVGLALGLILAATFGAAAGLGSTGAALVTVGIGALLTGAFHEDGLADSADALGGGYAPEDVFRILKDSRLGTFGVLALVVVVGLRVALLARIGVNTSDAMIALVLSHTLSRFPPVALMRALPYVTAGENSRSRAVVAGPRPRVAIAGAVAGVVAVACVLVSGLEAWRLPAMLVGIALTAGVCAWRFQRRVGGITGDFLGATQQLCDIVILAVLAWW